MKTPKLFILIFFLTITNISFGQKLNKVEREYFVLGTLNDYMGRDLDPREKNLLDRYDALQGPLITVVDSLLKIDYPISSYKVDRYLDSSGNLLSGKIFSDSLSTRFNSYYLFKESGEFTADNDPQLDFKPILRGSLKSGIFLSDSEKMAFLAGVFVRFGSVKDKTYEISLANSYSKAKVCYNLLVGFNCEPTYQVLTNFIPVGHHVYFYPSEKIKTYLQQFMYLRKRLDDSERKWFDMEASKLKHK